MDFYEQRAAAIQDELITTEARGYISRVIAGSSKEPHSHESFVMILAALPPLNLNSFWMMQPDAILSASHAGCSIARRSGRSKRIQQTSSPRRSLALPRELPMRSRSPLFCWLHLFQMEVRH